MASIDQKIGFVSGQIPQKMAVHKDIPFWESIESHYNSIRERDIIQAKEEAYHRAKAEFEKDHKELFVQITQLIQNLEESVPKAFREMEEALAHMACTLTRKLMANIPVDAERIKAVVSEAIGELERDAALQIRIHPEDLSLLSDGIEGNQAKQFHDSENLRFIPDENLTRGGCYIKTPFGDFDATMESKWARVIEAFHRRPKPQNRAPENIPSGPQVNESTDK